MNKELHAHQEAIGFLRRGYSSTGGAEAYLKRLAEGLRKKNYRVVLIGTGEWPSKEWPGGEVVTVASKNLRDFGEAALRLKQEKQIDLLFSFERLPGCDIFRAGDGVHTAWLERQRRVEPWLSYFIKKWLPKHRQILQRERDLFAAGSKTKIIANSQMVAQEIVDQFPISSDQIVVIPNGVPAAHLRSQVERAALRKNFEIHPDECVVLFVGSGWKRKGLKTALQAVERVNSSNRKNRKMSLWVAGKGKMNRYRSSAMKFLGPVKDLSTLYSVADLFILPTLYDPFSNASLEALAAGLPVITSAANGCSEILKPEHGTIVDDPLDVKAFAIALEQWQRRFEDPYEAELIRHACAARGAEFSIEKNVQATLQVIEQVL